MNFAILAQNLVEIVCKVLYSSHHSGELSSSVCLRVRKSRHSGCVPIVLYTVQTRTVADHAAYAGSASETGYRLSLIYVVESKILPIIKCSALKHITFATGSR